MAGYCYYEPCSKCGIGIREDIRKDCPFKRLLVLSNMANNCLHDLTTGDVRKIVILNLTLEQKENIDYYFSQPTMKGYKHKPLCYG